MIAAFTIARNEPFFLPRWLAYYGQHVDHCFVIDHETTDRSTRCLNAFVRRVDNGGVCFDHQWLCDTVADFQAELLQTFEQVIFADVDEFLCHPDGLGTFLQGNREETVRATGYNLLQAREEAAYDATRPILEQRAYWQRHRLYDKSLVSRVPLRWEFGFHHLAGKTDAPYAEGLTLVHLHQFGRALCHERHEARSQWQWAAGQREARNGEQWTLDRAELDGWMDEHLGEAVSVAEWLKEQVPF